MITQIEYAAIETQKDIDCEGRFQDRLDRHYDKDWYEEFNLELKARGVPLDEKLLDKVMGNVRESGEFLSESDFAEKYEDAWASEQYDREMKRT